MPIVEHLLDAKPATSGKHHFFGYYDKFPWSGDGRYLLALEVDFIDRQPTPEDSAVIGLIDTQNDNQWTPLDETYAWCWQQACMLQWFPGEPDRKIIYNQREGDRYVSVVRDIHTGETRTLPRPIYAVRGNFGLGLNFSRLHRTRPGYGYVGVPDAGADDPHPADDGIFWMDLTTGENRLVVSYDDARNFHPNEMMDGGQHWFNHIHISPDGSSFIWLHRWQYDLHQRRKWVDRLVTADVDGSNKAIVADDYFVSHLDYYSPEKVVAWARKADVGDRYFLYTRHSDEIEIIGDDLFSTDGHCTFSPDRQWMLTDTYPGNDQYRTLILYHMASNTRFDIGRFYAPPELTGPIRCDLHPRWSRDGRQVCIDSAHEGERQVYVIDVSSVIEKLA